MAGGLYDGSVPRLFQFACVLAVIPLGLRAQQIIDFESGGLKYKAMTRDGVTVMFSLLPLHIRDYAVLQVAISNGAPVSWSIKPEDCSFEKADGQTIRAESATAVILKMIQKATRGDVIKLVTAYEASLFNNTQIRSTNGYESRRQNAFAEVSSTKLKAAAAASAIALAPTKLPPGQSTDGAVFYANQGKPLGAGRVIVNVAGETFAFPVEEVRSEHAH